MVPSLFESDLLKANGIHHGFFTKGSVKEKPLTIAFGRGQADSVVTDNRKRVAGALGVPIERACFAQQQHTNRVRVVEKVGDDPPSDEPYDALVTALPNVLLAIYTADCVPILLSDPAQNVVGVAHCGWKGLRQKILEPTLVAMQRLGARRILAAIGPCIHAPHYRVDLEFLANFPEDEDCVVRKDGQIYFDLPALATKQLRNLGVEDVDELDVDTYEREDLFFSFRRSLERHLPLEGAHPTAIATRA